MRDKCITVADQDALEGMLDKYSLHEILVALGSICVGKADHVFTAWQDKGLGNAWLKAGRVLGRAYASKAVQAIS